MESKENRRVFEKLESITPADVQWLKDGSEKSGRYVNNPRTIIYKTKRGVSKGCTCFVMSDGGVKWRTWTARNSSDGLTTEEARVFAPEIAAKRDARKTEEENRKKAAYENGAPVKVGDIFGGSFGYDATLWEFFEVVKVSKTGKTIWTRELEHETKPGYGYNDWKCRPVPGEYKRGAIAEKHALKYTTWDKEPKPYFRQDSCVWPQLLSDPTAWRDADNYH